jgi:putative oxidoreductase
MAADAVNAGMLILRILLGIVFLAHGLKHARSRERTTNWFGSIGFKKPEFQWLMSTATETGVGVLLIAGLLTSLAAAGVIGIMFVAFWSVHRAAGFFITAFMQEGVDVEGWEYVFTLAGVALALAVVGPGEWSLDHALDLANRLDGWVGAAIAAGGVMVSAGQIATFYKPGQT